ncbi:MAG: LytR C-terminal domain-containing protein [Microgenomates group bacterium]
MAKIKNAFKSKHFIKIAVGVLVVASVATAGYFYWRLEQERSQNPSYEIEEVVAQVGKHMVLPEGTPVLATVTDKNALTEQAFFQKAEDGDKVLIYPDAQRVILYRPSVRKIIDVTSVRTQQSDASNDSGTSVSVDSLTAGSETAEGPQAEVEPVKVAIYNGTLISGLTRSVQNIVEASEFDVSIVRRENAALQNYESTQIINLGATDEQAQSFVNSLKGTLGTMPEGEDKPDADILIIVGSSFATAE